MDNLTRHRSAEFPIAVRQSSLKRFRAVPDGKENWRITPASMSFAELAQYLIHADNWLFRSLREPELRAIDGNPGEVNISSRDQYQSLLDQLVRTGEARAALLRAITDDDLARRIPDDRAVFGGSSSEATWTTRFITDCHRGDA